MAQGEADAQAVRGVAAAVVLLPLHPLVQADKQRLVAHHA
jgi:hypothetical protein